MKKFLVLFMTPVSIMEDWMKKAPEERKEMEDKMKADWEMWTEKNKAHIVENHAGTGKTKSIASTGVTDIKNNIMMYGVVQADSQDEAAGLFVGHPHLDIPEASVEVMEIKSW